MSGGIYSNERCMVCGSTFRDDGRTGLYCPNHPKGRASRFMVMFGGLCKRFKAYDDAYRFLTGVRFKTDEETFDEKDYRKDNPLGFTNMANRWLEYKSGGIRPGTYKNLRAHVGRAGSYFGQTNVKDIKYGHLEDFLKTLPLKDKSKHNIIFTIHAFYVWMKRRQEIKELPEFPIVSYELGYRKTVAKETQQNIIREVARICTAPKVAFGIRLLATYVSIRPKELLSLTEGNIDLANGYLHFPDTKEKKYKSVPILPADAEDFASFPLTFPAMRFFRHGKGVRGTPENHPFSHNILYSWWKKACANLGVEGVDLYGGTRHSSVRALRQTHSPEEVKQAAMSATNKAFDRYLGRPEDAAIRSMYGEAAKIVPIDKGLIRRKTG